MRESELLRDYRPLYDYLDGLNIYGVRDLARAFGVGAPTSGKKRDLILRLISVASGLSDPEPRSNKGARVKSGGASPESIEQVHRIVAACKEAMPHPAAGEGAKESAFSDSAADGRASTGYADRRFVGILERLAAGGRLCDKDGRRTDVFVAQSCIDAYGLREGDLVSGYAGERGDGCAEAVQIVGVGGLAPTHGRPAFEDLSPLLPAERIPLSASSVAAVRALERICPVGKGQRVLFRAPAGGGKTAFIREAARCAAQAGMRTVILAFGRPEECGEFSAAVPSASVFASPFGSQPAERIRLARLALAYCKRIAASGGDAVLLLDPLAELLRVCAEVSQMAGGEGCASLAEQLFASARRLQGAGTLTVIAAAPAEGAAFDRFAEAANCLLYGGGARIAGDPFGIDFARSFTRRADLLLSKEECDAADALRARLAATDAEGGAALLRQIQKENL